MLKLCTLPLGDVEQEKKCQTQTTVPIQIPKPGDQAKPHADLQMVKMTRTECGQRQKMTHLKRKSIVKGPGCGKNETPNPGTFIRGSTSAKQDK